MLGCFQPKAYLVHDVRTGTLLAEISRATLAIRRAGGARRRVVVIARSLTIASIRIGTIGIAGVTASSAGRLGLVLAGTPQAQIRGAVVPVVAVGIPAALWDILGRTNRVSHRAFLTLEDDWRDPF